MIMYDATEGQQADRKFNSQPFSAINLRGQIISGPAHREVDERAT